MTKRILISGTRNASSWAFRAWLALKEQNIPFEERIIDIRRPQRWSNLKDIKKISPAGCVPILKDQGAVIFDSLAIMEYANDIGEYDLLPNDVKEKARARSYMAWQHSSFGKVCPCLSFESAFYPEKKNLSEAEKQQINWIYGVWEKSIISSGGSYLVGNYSLADIMSVPSLIRLSSHLRPSKMFPSVQNWMSELLGRKYVIEWMKEANELDPIYLPGYL